MTYPTYQLQLHKTYYDKGFFNLGVAVSRFVRLNSGPAMLYLGSSKSKAEVSINRKANLNGTPRVMGGVPVKDWIQRNCSENEIVEVEILAPTELWLHKRRR